MARSFKAKSTRPVRSISPKRSSRAWVLPVLCVILAFLAGVYLLDQRLRPLVTTAASALAKRAGAEALSEALSFDIATDVPTGSLVTTDIGKGSGGQLAITSINMAKLSQLQQLATHDAQERLAALSKQTIRLPLVQMFSGSLLSGTTMTIPVRITLKGAVHSAIESDVETKGVNQVVHIIYLRVTADIMVITPFVSTPTQVETRAPVAYLIMSGPVPNAYYGTDSYGKTNHAPNFRNSSASK